MYDKASRTLHRAAETHVWLAVGRFSLVADELVESSQSARVSMTFGR